MLGLVFALGCASNTAPADFLPTPEQAGRDAFGGWIELRYLQDGRLERAEGELIAVTGDSLWVLGRSGAIVVSTAAVRHGKLTTYDSRSGVIGAYTFIGVISTISNGWFLIFTAPAWIITGTVSAAHQSHVPERTVPPFTWGQLAAFARFPQGLPAAVHLETLQPKLR